MINIELIIWGILPALLALASLGLSLYGFIRHVGIVQALFLIIVFAGMSWSLAMLWSIFVKGAWPTYLPHIVIGLILPVLAVQLLLASRQGRRGGERGDASF